MQTALAYKEQIREVDAWIDWRLSLYGTLMRNNEKGISVLLMQDQTAHESVKHKQQDNVQVHSPEGPSRN